MTFKEIDTLAANLNELPEKPSLEELYCYTLLSVLYKDVRSGAVDRETAKVKRLEIKQAYIDACERHERYKAVYAQYAAFTRKGSKYVHEIKNAIQSNADGSTIMKLALQLYGALTSNVITPAVLIEKMEEQK